MLRVLFPHLDGLVVDAVRGVGSVVRIEAATCDAVAPCPSCSAPSRRVHSRYRRQLADTSVTGREVVIMLRVRRLFCDNIDCGKKTFAEQVPWLAARHGRRTLLLQRVLGAVALALGGRPGARLTGHLAARVSRMTLLRHVRALPDPSQPTPRVLGVDDFALRRGHRYGTILIDMESRRPIDVLTDRSAETLRTWLQARTGIEIVCRDRAGAYAEGVASWAPLAIQVADRWHIWKNLGDAVERTIARHRHCLIAAVGGLDDVPQLPDIAEVSAGLHRGPVEPGLRQDRVAIRTKQRFAEVQALLAQGKSIRGISTELGLARGTARRFARAESPEELLVNNRTGYRASILDEFKPYLHQRWNEGCANAALLFDEITARGYRGQPNLVRAYLQAFRGTAHVPGPPPKAPAPRRVTAWIMTDPARIDPGDQRRLDLILTASPGLAALAGHVRSFAAIMKELRGGDLEKWMNTVDADDQPALHSFVRGLRRDQDAVTAGLTLPWNSGAVEGHVNRIKMLKRQMFGRAKPDLLRKRILLSD
ncbi:ISL3 family transposase [Nocardia salmonicida]|uniref:ISL3 family transposase n=1 Tax=Nocardia salmonicida TaxID=53431 RepID=UPI000A8188F8|nr:ISL3 family transposase [Nocardia salmonicida]